MSRTRRVLFATTLLACVGHAALADTLFNDLGGKPGIERLVTKIMVVMGSDSRVAPTFSDTNMVRFKRLLQEQLCMVTGGDCQYTGRSMAEAHKGVHVATAQFNALAEDVRTAMEQLDMSFSLQNRLLAVLAPMHREVVSQ